jgi:caa(3)-type oxidase subunit IV
VTSASARLTYVWVILCALTVAAWWLGPAHARGTHVASLPVTIAVLAMGLVKARLIIQYFMEVRTAPRWLRLFTDIWLIALWGAILVIYLY